MCSIMELTIQTYVRLYLGFMQIMVCFYYFTTLLVKLMIFEDMLMYEIVIADHGLQRANEQTMHPP